jgi:hypothetical protein
MQESVEQLHPLRLRHHFPPLLRKRSHWGILRCQLFKPPHEGPAPPAKRRCTNAARIASFDHFVGAGEQRGGHVEAERLRDNQVDDEIKFLLD